MDAAVFWRDDIDSLAFSIEGHGGICVIHRRALRTLIGHLPEPQEALDFFENRRAAFEVAARAKILRAGLAFEANFHLTSRDVAASP
ncbi:hypothetical protein ACFSM5_13680 [Lacibacterium aquatile]|uniref:DUF1488 domain-containing protein n=1 Tax=Lacibacterium aquatile TaxID=1168082 RepID=A0ABW5DSP4_9PROT